MMLCCAPGLSSTRQASGAFQEHNGPLGQGGVNLSHGGGRSAARSGHAAESVRGGGAGRVDAKLLADRGTPGGRSTASSGKARPDKLALKPSREDRTNFVGWGDEEVGVIRSPAAPSPYATAEARIAILIL